MRSSSGCCSKTSRIELRGDEQVRVREHRALRPAGGAGGVDQHREIGGLAQRDAPLPFAGMRRVVFAPDHAQRVEADHLRIVEVAQAVHVEHDDLAQVRQPRAHLQRLVELLVVLDEQIDRARSRRTDTRPAPARRSDRCRSTRRPRRGCPCRHKAIRGWCWRAPRRIRPARSRAPPAPCRSRARSGRTPSR